MDTAPVGRAYPSQVGNGARGHNGDGRASLKTSLNNPYGVCFDPKGNLFIADMGNHRVRKVSGLVFGGR